jgi:hypothetical protein
LSQQNQATFVNNIIYQQSANGNNQNQNQNQTTNFPGNQNQAKPMNNFYVQNQNGTGNNFTGHGMVNNNNGMVNNNNGMVNNNNGMVNNNNGMVNNNNGMAMNQYNYPNYNYVYSNNLKMSPGPANIQLQAQNPKGDISNVGDSLQAKLPIGNGIAGLQATTNGLSNPNGQQGVNSQNCFGAINMNFQNSLNFYGADKYFMPKNNNWCGVQGNFNILAGQNLVNQGQMMNNGNMGNMINNVKPYKCVYQPTNKQYEQSDEEDYVRKDSVTPAEGDQVVQDSSPLIPASDPKLKIVPDSTQSMEIIPDSKNIEGLFVITEKDHSIPTPQLAESETDSTPQKVISNLFSTNGLPLLTKNDEINSE